MSLRIKKEDQVQVIAGKDKGTVAKVLAVIPAKNRVVVEGVNKISRHTKSQGQQRPGGIIEREASIHISNVMLYCGSCKKASRFGAEQRDDKKVRVCKKCGNVL